MRDLRPTHVAALRRPPPPRPPNPRLPGSFVGPRPAVGARHLLRGFPSFINELWQQPCELGLGWRRELCEAGQARPLASRGLPSAAGRCSMLLLPAGHTPQCLSAQSQAHAFEDKRQPLTPTGARLGLWDTCTRLSVHLLPHHQPQLEHRAPAHPHTCPHTDRQARPVLQEQKHFNIGVQSQSTPPQRADTCREGTSGTAPRASPALPNPHPPGSTP